MSRDLKTISHADIWWKEVLWIDETANVQAVSQERVRCVQELARKLEGGRRREGRRRAGDNISSCRALQAADLYSKWKQGPNRETEDQLKYRRITLGAT